MADEKLSHLENQLANYQSSYADLKESSSKENQSLITQVKELSKEIERKTQEKSELADTVDKLKSE